MLLKRDILKGVENLKLQGEVFPFETNKQTNRRKGNNFNRVTRDNGLFHLIG